MRLVRAHAALTMLVVTFATSLSMTHSDRRPPVIAPG